MTILLIIKGRFVFFQNPLYLVFYMIIDPAGGVPQSRNSINLCTRKGNKINNSQILDFVADAHFHKQIEDLKIKYLNLVTRPNTISAIYNCHGMTFASRRTGIEVNDELIKILKEDSYIEIKDIAHLLAGDTILYCSENGEIEHSGIIISRPVDKNFISSIVVLSKWGSGFEVIHPIYNCPYELQNIKFYRCIN